MLQYFIKKMKIESDKEEQYVIESINSNTYLLDSSSFENEDRVFETNDRGDKFYYVLFTKTVNAESNDEELIKMMKEVTATYFFYDLKSTVNALLAIVSVYEDNDYMDLINDRIDDSIDDLKLKDEKQN